MYTVDLVSQSAVDGKPKFKRRKKGAGATSALEQGQPAKKTRRTCAAAAVMMEYAVTHGLHRDHSDGLHDAPHTGTHPIFNPETTTNEELLVLVQSVQCRRVVWATILRMI